MNDKPNLKTLFDLSKVLGKPITEAISDQAYALPCKDYIFIQYKYSKVFAKDNSLQNSDPEFSPCFIMEQKDIKIVKINEFIQNKEIPGGIISYILFNLDMFSDRHFFQGAGAFILGSYSAEKYKSSEVFDDNQTEIF